MALDRTDTDHHKHRDDTATINVGTGELRNALNAVTPHADPKDNLKNRVRLEITDHEILISACCSNTIALAAVPVLSGSAYGETIQFDIVPKHVDVLAKFFRTGGSAAGDEDQPGDQLQLKIHGSELTITDTGGLFDGQSITLVGFGTPPEYPNIPGLLKRHSKRTPERTERVGLYYKYLGQFLHAARIYREPLMLEPGGDQRQVIVTCGPNFVGAIGPARISEDAKIHQKQWRQDWADRFDQAADLTGKNLQMTMDALPDQVENATPDTPTRRKRGKQTTTTVDTPDTDLGIDGASTAPDLSVIPGGEPVY